MDNMGERLRSEREHLGETQDRFAEAAHISKRALVNYEQGKRYPDADFLANIAAIGVDVLYVITGQRSQPVSAEAVLPKEERALLNSYRLCSATARKNLLQTAALLAAGLGSAPAGRPGMNIQVSAQGGHVVAGRDITIHNPGAKSNAKGRNRPKSG